MRILVLSSTPREPDNHLLWEGLQQFAEVDLHYIPKDEQRHLKKVLGRFDLASYDRVVLDLLFRHVSRHASLLSTVAGLVLYEEDACQEFIENSRWHRRFSAFYRKLPHVRVILTGHHVTEQFKAMGVDACFLPKGYDSSSLYETHQTRDIKLGFIGRLASDAYHERKEFLERAAREFGVQILRTQPGDDYRNALNRIEIFVSADIGLGEYMAKNFEAMACGCVLLAKEQGKGEEGQLCLLSGENLVTYHDYADFRAKLKELIGNQSMCKEISRAGADLAARKFAYGKLSPCLFEYLKNPTMQPRKNTIWRTLSAAIHEKFRHVRIPSSSSN